MVCTDCDSTAKTCTFFFPFGPKLRLQLAGIARLKRGTSTAMKGQKIGHKAAPWANHDSPLRLMERGVFRADR